MNDVRKLLPFYVVIFLGFFGYALTIALFIPLLVDKNINLLPADASTALIAIISGALLATYPLGQFIGSPIMGKLSDHYGRKKILIISLIVCIFGFACIAMSIDYQNIYLLFISCFITGLFESNMAISQSVIADHSEGDAARKAKLIGYAFSACSFGYIAGPLVGGLGATTVGYSFPFWLTAGGIVFLILWIQFSFNHKFIISEKPSIKLLEAITSFKDIFADVSLRKVYFINFLIFFAVQGLYRVVPLYAEYTWHPNLQAFTTLISYVSFIALVANIMIMARLAKKFSAEKLLGHLLIFSSIAAILIIIPSQYNWIWLTYGLLVIPTIMLLTTCTTWLSNQVESDKQGQALGNNQALLVLGECLSAAFGGLIAAIYVSLPIIIMAAILMACYFILKLRTKDVFKS